MIDRWPRPGERQAVMRAPRLLKVGPRGHRVSLGTNGQRCLTCGGPLTKVLRERPYWRHARHKMLIPHPPRLPRFDRLPNRVGMALSPRDLASLRAYALTGSYKVAARDLGISEFTVREHLHRAYQRLDVDGAIDAFRALGWLVVP